MRMHFCFANRGRVHTHTHTHRRSVLAHIMYWAFAVGFPVLQIESSRSNRVGAAYASQLRRRQFSWPVRDDDAEHGRGIVDAFAAYSSDEHRKLVKELDLRSLGQRLVVYTMDVASGKSRSYTIGRQLIPHPNPTYVARKLLVAVSCRILSPSSVWPLSASVTTSRFVRWTWTITQPLWDTSVEHPRDASVSLDVSGPSPLFRMLGPRREIGTTEDDGLIPWAEDFDCGCPELRVAEPQGLGDVFRRKVGCQVVELSSPC